MRAVGPLTRVVAAVAMLKISLGLSTAALVLTSSIGTAIVTRYVLMLLHVAVFTAAGLLLVVGGRTDRRAAHLGIVFLLVASVLADQLVAPLASDPGTAAVVLIGLFAIQADAFSPYLLFLFICDFPLLTDDGIAQQRLAIAIRISLVAGVSLLVANLVLFLASQTVALSGLETL